MSPRVPLGFPREQLSVVRLSFICTAIVFNVLWLAAAQQTFASDPKYKKYTQQVEKCLNSFENIHEWADCIAFLKQLLKVPLHRPMPLE